MCIDWNLLIIPVYFFYGLAFYSMGLGLLIESGRASELGFARSMRLLAGFGLLHGIHEWMDFLERALWLYNESTLPLWLLWFRVALLAGSFLSLLAFGEHLRALDCKCRMRIWLLGLAVVWFAASCIVVQIVYTLDEINWLAVSDVLARYVLGIPASVLAAVALFQQRKYIQNIHMQPFIINFSIAAIAILVYGVVGQLFVRSTIIFPSNVLNQDVFINTCGFPVQLLRAFVAVVLAISLIGALRMLEIESEQRLKAIEDARRESEYRSREELARVNANLQASEAEARQLLAELKKREALRTEFLQQVTAAQESERKRVARELHDGTGQMLTGLALGLHGLGAQIRSNPDWVIKQLSSLESMVTDTIGELRFLIQDLRPPQLDDMGLVPAIRAMLERYEHINGCTFEMKITGEPHPLPSEVETLLFRIVQEGVNNIIKHAHADHACVCLEYTDDVIVCIHDDGVGCDPQKIANKTPQQAAWGLIGIEERANLINASWTFESEVGKGTKLRVCLPNSRQEVLVYDH